MFFECWETGATAPVRRAFALRPCGVESREALMHLPGWLRLSPPPSAHPPMSLFRKSICTILLGATLLSGCAGKAAKRMAAHRAGTGNDTAESGAKEGPLWQMRLGRVVLVNRSLDFVLIDAGTSPSPEPGSRLRAYAGGEPSAELAVSVHQQRPYLIADILSGDPHVSDMVVPFRGGPSPGEGRPPPRAEPESKQALMGSEARKKEPLAADAGGSPLDKSALSPLHTPDIPQIERRPPPLPQSLLTPSRTTKEEADSIIPGLPVPNQSPAR